MIEKMKASHIKEVAELEKICFSSPWSEKALTEELNNENSFFVVKLENEKLIAYGGMHIAAGECYIDNIGVFPKFRGKGIGREITEKLIEKAEEIKAEFISLEVRKTNEKAVSLYLSCGFKILGERKNFYQNPTENALIMTRVF